MLIHGSARIFHCVHQDAKSVNLQKELKTSSVYRQWKKIDASDSSVNICVSVVKVPLDAYVMDFVFSEREDGGIFDNKNGMDYHIPVFGGIAKEPPMHIVHIAVEMAPIAKVS